jgi:hypothetical protein
MYRGISKQGQWVYGSKLELEGKTYIIPVDAYIGMDHIDGQPEDEERVCIDPCIEVLPETVGMGTGVEDRDGKEIYQGDIYDNPCAIGLLECVFISGGFCGKHIGDETDIENRSLKGRIYPMSPSKNVKITGSIHDHLLQEAVK